MFTHDEEQSKKNFELRKEQTIEAVRKMLENNEKGACGFMTCDYGGCGNPDIFPKYEDGLKKGILVYTPHLCCMYDWRILNPYQREYLMLSECNSNCAICHFKRHPELREKVLERFLHHLEGGLYDKLWIEKGNKWNLLPLLTREEFETLLK